MATKTKARKSYNIIELVRELIQKYKQPGNVDIFFLLTILGLLSLGLVMMFSASYPSALDEGKSPAHYIFKQGIGAVFGLGLMWFFSRTDADIFKNKLTHKGSGKAFECITQKCERAG